MSTTETKPKNMVNLRHFADYDEAMAYFDGVAQGVRMASEHFVLNETSVAELLALIESHRNVYTLGVEL